MTKAEEHKERIRQVSANDILSVESGHKVYWPGNRGYLTSGDLRIIADYLDELNKDWDDLIEKELSEK